MSEPQLPATFEGPVSDSQPLAVPAGRGLQPLTTDDDRLARVALTWLVEPGTRDIWHLVQDEGAPEALDQALSGKLPNRSLRTAIEARARTGDPLRLAEAVLYRAERQGARLVIPSDPEWPAGVESLSTLELDGGQRIDHHVRPPLCLWVRGAHRLDEAFARSVAIVGARAATPYGTHVTHEMAYRLAECGWTVVSGGAFGIDAAAHRAALTAGGLTVAVLACGVDRPYPAGNAAMFEHIAETGVLMSEWPPGADPLRHRFLIRNRVIAAATVGSVIVEAAARSGAVQTLSRTVALGRRAMVVPGPVTSAMSVGCHELLRRHPETVVVTGADHVLEEVGRIGEYLAETPRGQNHVRDDLDEDSALVLEAIPRRGTIGPEALAARAGLGVRTVLRRLSLLETIGLVVRRPDGVALARHPAKAPP